MIYDPGKRLLNTAISDASLLATDSFSGEKASFTSSKHLSTSSLGGFIRTGACALRTEGVPPEIFPGVTFTERTSIPDLFESSLAIDPALIDIIFAEAGLSALAVTRPL